MVSIGVDVKDFKAWIDYIRHFKGRKIRLVFGSSYRPSSNGLAIWKEIAEGTIDFIVDNPYGIMLKDVKEIASHEYIDQIESQVQETPRSYLRASYDKKFYNLSLIREIEFVP